MAIRVLSTVILLLALLQPAAADTTFASAQLDETMPQCTTLVKECFAHSGLDRANCFYSVGTHPFCEGTALGTLTLQRWRMAPSRPDGTESAPGLLGPQLVDTVCLKKFDNQLSGKLIQGAVTNPTLEMLAESLEQCFETMAIELVRP